MAIRFRAIWIPQVIVGGGAVLFTTGTLWMLFTGEAEPALTLTFWGLAAMLPGMLLLMISAFAPQEHAPIARLGRKRWFASFLASAGFLLCVATVLAMLASGEYQALHFVRAWGMPIGAVGCLLLFLGLLSGTTLDKRWPVELDRERKRNIALARGAQPGDLMEAPAESSAGDLSEAETPGAVSIARVEKAKS